jgi:hypothetical protein
MSRIQTLKLAALALTVGTMFSGAANAANTADADASAKAVAAIAITKTTDFNFGTIVPGASSGTVVLSTGGSRSVSGGTVLGNGTTPAAAVFGVTGDGTSTFSVTFSNGVTLSDGSSHTMSVGTYVLKVGAGSDQTSNYSGTLSSGAATLTVGATLSVDTSGNNPAGTYSTANQGGTPLTVTVNYN